MQPFSWPKQQMTREEKMNCALVEKSPSGVAELSFYQGLGFKCVGGEHYYVSDAISAFKNAIELDQHYNMAASEEIADCYDLIREYEKSTEIRREIIRRLPTLSKEDLFKEINLFAQLTNC